MDSTKSLLEQEKYLEALKEWAEAAEYEGEYLKDAASDFQKAVDSKSVDRMKVDAEVLSAHAAALRRTAKGISEMLENLQS